MIDAEPAPNRARSANAASPVLPLEHRVVVRLGDAVVALQALLVAALGVLRLALRCIVRIGCVAAAVPRIALDLVGGAPAAVDCEVSFPELRIFGVACGDLGVAGKTCRFGGNANAGTWLGRGFPT